MNISHLGDALDYWKGAVISRLNHRLDNLRVVPMFTDENVVSVWTTKRIALYANLLSVSQNSLLLTDQRFSAFSRAGYLSSVDLEGDLFLDPDTGIAPISGGDARHVRIGELVEILPLRASRRLLMVYQHSSREDDWTDACLQRLADDPALGDYGFCAYWAGTASMILISRDMDRLEALRKELLGFLDVLPSEYSRVTTIHRRKPASPA